MLRKGQSGTWKPNSINSHKVQISTVQNIWEANDTISMKHLRYKKE